MKELEAATYGKVTRRILPILFISYVLAYLDRVNVGFAKLQMQKDLGLASHRGNSYRMGGPGTACESGEERFGTRRTLLTSPESIKA